MLITQWKLPRIIALTAFTIATCAFAAVPPPTFWVNVSHPNGLAATQFRMIYTSQDNMTELFKVDALGFVHPFATIPAGSGIVQEVYPVISPGLGGFLPNAVYACRGNKVFEVPAAGGAGTVFADFTTQSVPDGQHCGITFDEVGTFHHDLIVSFENGTVWKVDSSGAKTLIVGLTNSITEGPQVTPSGNLLVTQEVFNTIWQITPAGAVSLFNNSVPLPESIHLIPNSFCTYGVTGGAFFSTDINIPPNPPAGDQYPPNPNPPGMDWILSYPPSDFTGLSGDFLVPLEGYNGGTPPRGIYLISGGAVSVFDTTNAPHEGSTFVDCLPPPPPSHCTLTQGGYKNHFNSLVTGFPPNSLTLGTVAYSDAQLNAILQNNAVHGNGLLSLAHQLITAELNIYYGSIPPSAVVNAIAQANALIGGLVVPPIGSGYLSPSSTSSIENVLDAFNNSNDCR